MASAKAVAGDEITFQVQLRDAYGNILSEPLRNGRVEPERVLTEQVRKAAQKDEGFDDHKMGR